jgi:hypothetical protein
MPKSIPLRRPLAIKRQDVIKYTIRTPKNKLLLEWVTIEARVRWHAKRPIERNPHAGSDFLCGFNDALGSEEAQSP